MNNLIPVIARDFKDFTPLSGFDAGIPLYSIRLFVEKLKKQELTSFEAYMLHAIALGVNTQHDIAYLLGVESRDLISPGASLLKNEYVTQTSIITTHGRVLQTTQKGLQALSEQGPPPTPTRINHRLYFNALTWTVILPENNTYTTDQMSKEGFTILPKSRNEKLTLGNFTIEEINSVSSFPENEQIITLLELKKLEPVYIAPVQVIQLQHNKTNEPAVAVYRNSRLQQPETTNLQRMLENKEFTFPSEVYKLQENTINIPIPVPPTVHKATEKLLNNEAILNKIHFEIEEFNEQRSNTQNQREREELERRIRDLKEELKVKLEDNAMLKETLQQSRVEFLKTEEHRPILVKALKEALREVIIISPWMNLRTCNDEFQQLVANAIKRGVNIRIGYGMGKERDGREADRNQDNIFRVKRALHRLISPSNQHMLEIKETSGTHQKILVCDDIFAATGSFNWLSYLGQKDDNYRNETGTLFRHKDQIKQVKDIAEDALLCANN